MLGLLVWSLVCCGQPVTGPFLNGKRCAETAFKRWFWAIKAILLVFLRFRMRRGFCLSRAPFLFFMVRVQLRWWAPGGFLFLGVLRWMV